MRRFLPRIRLVAPDGRRHTIDAVVSPAAFARAKHARRFDRFVARRRPLPAGFTRGLTPRPWTVKT